MDTTSRLDLRPFTAEIIPGDVCKERPDGLFHALLCDPPYHLTSITERFGKNGSAPAQYGSDGAFQRASKGFMGQTWDGGDVAFRPETWAHLAEFLYPGAFGMAFASSRGWHRLAVAIEDAGLIIHPTIFGWAYGSGFPKATRIDTQIDKMAGAEREIVGTKEFTRDFRDISGGRYGDQSTSSRGVSVGITAPATPLAQAWEGHRYGLQALKPALEPIIVFQKPYAGRPVDNITQTGAGALWIEGSRIAAQDELVRPLILRQDNQVYGLGLGAGIQTEPSGRWPANFLLDEEAAAQLGEEARFFFNYQSDQVDEADPVYYCAKASRSERDGGLDERNLHPTIKPIALAQYLATLLLPPESYAPRRILVPFSGSGSEMIGTMFAGWDESVGIEMTGEYVDLAWARIEYWRGRQKDGYQFGRKHEQS